MPLEQFMTPTTPPVPAEFLGFPKLARLSRECIITEKIDGTNAQILITPDFNILAGSRTRWVTPEDDNFGFAKWVAEHKTELLKLGPGRHFGEWWGHGIQRGYGLEKGDRNFYLFNTVRWCLHCAIPQPIKMADPRQTKMQDVLPPCCGLVPELYRGIFTTDACERALSVLRERGSVAAPGFTNPEGIVVYHVAANIGFKKTLQHDESHKTAVQP